jgi:hypothetical protein
MGTNIDAQATRNFNRVFGGLFLLIGFVAIIGGVVWLAKIAQFSQTAHRAAATIDAIDETSGTRGRARYPRYSFVDDRGKSHTKRSSFPLDGKEERGWAVAQVLEVLYDPENPEESKLNDFGQMWLTPITFTGFAMVWTLVVGWVTRSK